MAEPFAIAVLGLIVCWWWLTLAVQASPGDWAFDFRQFWQGAHDVVTGASPYPSRELLATAHDGLDPEGVQDVLRFPYPAAALLPLLPLGPVSFHTAAAIWSAGLIVSLAVALRIVGVHDWRVYAIVVSSAPVISSVRLGTYTPLLVLAIAITWRWRDRRWVSGTSLGVGIALKLFLWPLVVWLVATRRYAAAAVSAGLAAARTLGTWAASGVDGFGDYPELVRRLADVVAPGSLSLVALGLEMGLPRTIADVLPWIVGLSLLAGVAMAARHADGDRVAFALAVAAAFAFTPIVWLHYFTLLVVPVAVYRPRLAVAWLLFWVFWLSPSQGSGGDPWRILLVDATLVALLWLAFAGLGRRGSPATT
jgi:hypothetical protein